VSVFFPNGTIARLPGCAREESSGGTRYVNVLSNGTGRAIFAKRPFNVLMCCRSEVVLWIAGYFVFLFAVFCLQPALCH
jgi:hypothetical protein